MTDLNYTHKTGFGRMKFPRPSKIKTSEFFKNPEV